MNKNKIKMITIALLAIVAIYIFITKIFIDNKEDELEQSLEEVNITPPTLEFGLKVDSLLHDVKIVSRNQYLSDILTSYDMNYRLIDQLVKNSKEKFDVKKIKQGNKYHVYYSQDSLGKNVKYFVYEINKTEFVTYKFDEDNVNCLLGCKKITKKNRWLSGEINNSLWMSIKEQNHNPILALELSEIYAWTIDFFGIQKGDKYVLNYDELYVEDERIGIGEIHYSLLNHKSTSYYAFSFINDTINPTIEYFDETGKSLRKAFLKAPLRYSRISSKFSNNRFHPVLKIYRPHHGIDYAAPTGTPVHTIGDGNVIKVAYQKRGAGRYVKIKHNSVYTTVYMHLSRFGKGIKAGKRVKQGDIIGYVGSSGLATGPHLDFRVYKNGKAINPLLVKSPPVKPIDSLLMKDYNKIVNDQKPTLDSLFTSLTQKNDQLMNGSIN